MADIEQFEIEAASNRAQAAIDQNYWVVKLGLKPTLDGNRWCFLWGENIQEGVFASADTPAAAILAFENAMYSRFVSAEEEE